MSLSTRYSLHEAVEHFTVKKKKKEEKMSTIIANLLLLTIINLIKVYIDILVKNKYLLQASYVIKQDTLEQFITAALHQILCATVRACALQRCGRTAAYDVPCLVTPR